MGGLERLSLASRRPVASTSRRRRALWNVLDAFGIPAGVVRVWGTHPPETIRGFVLSPYFHLLRGDPARAGGRAPPARPPRRGRGARRVAPRPRPRAARRPRGGDGPPGRRRSTTRSSRPSPGTPSPPTSPTPGPRRVLDQAYAPSLLVVSFQGYDAGRARLLPLRPPRGVRQRRGGRGPALRAGAGPLRVARRALGGGARAGPRPRGRARGGLRRTASPRRRSGAGSSAR